MIARGEDQAQGPRERESWIELTGQEKSGPLSEIKRGKPEMRCRRGPKKDPSLRFLWQGPVVSIRSAAAARRSSGRRRRGARERARGAPTVNPPRPCRARSAPVSHGHEGPAVLACRGACRRRLDLRRVSVACAGRQQPEICQLHVLLQDMRWSCAS